MEDYIYIIIGLIWLVFTVVKGNQKKKSQQQAASGNATEAVPEPIEQKTFEDILSEILNPTATLTNQPAPIEHEEEVFNMEAEAVAVNEEEKRTEYQSLEEIFAAEAESRLAAVSVMEMPEDDAIIASQAQNRKPKNTIDLRKAIVYQAILERPYA